MSKQSFLKELNIYVHQIYQIFEPYTIIKVVIELHMKGK